VAELDPSTWGFLADALVVVHLAIVLFVIAGAAAVLVGWICRWQWVRNPWFRLAHLALVVFVAAQAACGQLCPLTVWEHDLRVKAGQPYEGGSFIGRLAHDVLFVDVPQATLDIVYIVFAVVMVVLLVGCRPRLRRRPPAAPG
jgi:hypothetical protein